VSPKKVGQKSRLVYLSWGKYVSTSVYFDAKLKCVPI